MIRGIIISGCILFFTVHSCGFDKDKTKDGRYFPDVEIISGKLNSDFVTTFDANFPINKNIVYASTLCAAWDTARKLFPAPFQWIGNPDKELLAIHNSKFWQNALLSGDYTYEIDKGIDGISVGVKFFKGLNFRKKFNPAEDGMQFGKTKVQAFMWYGNGNESIEILYFKNEYDFFIRLHTLDTTQELILVMDPAKYNSFNTLWQQVKSKRYSADKERIQGLFEWKYAFAEEDILLIPKVAFNLQKNYENLAGQKFISGNGTHTLVNMWQRNAFLMDEIGVKVESESMVTYDSAGMPEPEPPKPQHLMFNRPFYIFMKRRGNFNPYFGLYIQNPELLMKK